MENTASIVTIHMVCSLDGYIASHDGDLSWMESNSHFPKGKALTDDYIKDVLDTIDCYVMGSKTYQDALRLGWPYGEKPCYVLSSKLQTSKIKTVQFYSGSLERLIDEKLRSLYGSIWIVGGSELIKHALETSMADELIVSIMPVILGSGLPFFKNIQSSVKLQLKEAVAFKDGMVELTYRI